MIFSLAEQFSMVSYQSKFFFITKRRSINKTTATTTIYYFAKIQTRNSRYPVFYIQNKNKFVRIQFPGYFPTKKNKKPTF